MGYGGLVVSHLQYADDTIILDEASIENLWIIQFILKHFELTLSLMANLSKRCLFGINIGESFLEVIEILLH